MLEFFYSGVGFPKWKVLVTSVVPSKYCPPESTKWIISFVMVEVLVYVG